MAQEEFAVDAPEWLILQSTVFGNL